MATETQRIVRINTIEGLTKIRIRRGDLRTLPKADVTTAGEPKFALDAGNLYLDDGLENVLIGGRSANMSKVDSSFADGTEGYIIGDLKLRPGENEREMLLIKTVVDAKGVIVPVMNGDKDTGYRKKLYRSGTFTNSGHGEVDYIGKIKTDENLRLEITSSQGQENDGTIVISVPGINVEKTRAEGVEAQLNEAITSLPTTIETAKNAAITHTNNAIQQEVTDRNAAIQSNMSNALAAGGLIKTVIEQESTVIQNAVAQLDTALKEYVNQKLQTLNIIPLPTEDGTYEVQIVNGHASYIRKEI